MENENKFYILWEQLIRLSNSIKGLENRVYMIGEEKLFPVEMHVLTEIYHNPEIGVVELAGNLGVTKGAVSQKIKILCEKEFLTRQKSKANKKIFHITKKGKNICMIHDALSQEIMDDIKKRLELFSNEKFDVLVEGISLINDYFDTYEVENHPLLNFKKN
ncbi:MarR family winged helix-turn-helix transcriptional regulator [Geosporobacter ferrireducens]|uniref:MarR family winged helix-turn-helix transcriptional regulator n=1 Tax=Geosporobacter ferrireducens TaxID=1424294 RepID=UPI00139AD1B5|nr:MarR family winged helix-turn-helix transcriptional regulator [Geosporobacter ferrireducens]MTI55724.1 winged helix-turn-helix transcriptional regulator [Geosporobacter ferrireducens]